MLPAGFHFGEPKWLLLLLLAPALGLLFWRAEHTAARRLARLIASPKLRERLTGAASAGRRRWRYALLLLGLAGLAFTLARPQWGYLEEHVERKGLDLILIADVSKSMLAIDLPPNRLTRERLAMEDLLNSLTGDRVGLVAFAGTAFLQAPMTVDYDAVRSALTDLDTETIPQGGTNLRSAIDMALDAFGKAEGHNRAIVLMSDGESTVDEGAEAKDAAARAAKAGVRIFTLGIGTPEGSLIPLGNNSGEFVRDPEGKVVRTKLDESALDAIAKAANGFYLRLGAGQADIHKLEQDGLGTMKKSDIDARDTRRPIERFQWPLGAAILLLAAAMALGERRRIRAPLAAALLLPFMGHAAANDDPLSLYATGKYNEAYQGFSELAQKHPALPALDFDAGTSAFMNGKYDDAMRAFGKSLASPDPDLQQKSQYNLGSTLYKRGESEQDTEKKVKTWREALKFFDDAAESAKKRNEPTLAKDSTFNREFVQRQIDDALKPKPTPPPQNKNDQKDDKKQDQKQQQQQKDKDQQKPDQKNQDKKQDQKDQSQKQSDDKSGQQDKQDESGKKDQQNDPSKGAPSPSPSPSSGQDQNSPSQSQPTPSAGASPSPSQDGEPQQPRQRGDFKPQDGGSPSPGESPPEMAEAEDAPAEPGKMNAEQARALLDSLRSEDEHIDLTDQNAKKRKDPSIKDW